MTSLHLEGAGRNEGTPSSCTDGEDGDGEINEDDDDFLEEIECFSSIPRELVHQYPQGTTPPEPVQH